MRGTLVPQGFGNWPALVASVCRDKWLQAVPLQTAETPSQSGGRESEINFRRATLPPKAPGTTPPPASSCRPPALMGVPGLWTLAPISPLVSCPSVLLPL